MDAHLVVEDLGLARLGLGDERVVEDVEDILADLLKLGLDLLAVVADGADVLLRALGLLLLLDGRNDAPRRASGADNVLVGDRQKVALVNGELTGDLCCVSRALMGACAVAGACSFRSGCGRAYLGDFLRNSQHVSWGEQRRASKLTFM